MRPDETPFEACWWGSSLEKAGLATLRPDMGTYGRYSYQVLPAVPVEVRGHLEWLERARRHPSHIGQEKADQLAGAAAALREAAQELGVGLPELFVRFLSLPELQSRVRSNTDCYLDISPRPVPYGATGHLVRFLADSQGCLFWYLYFPRTAPGYAVVASAKFYGTPEEDWEQEDVENDALDFVAESFESFLWRFWVENEIWYSVYYDKTPLPEHARLYLADYRSRGEERA